MAYQIRTSPFRVFLSVSIFSVNAVSMPSFVAKNIRKKASNMAIQSIRELKSNLWLFCVKYFLNRARFPPMPSRINKYRSTFRDHKMISVASIFNSWVVYRSWLIAVLEFWSLILKFCISSDMTHVKSVKTTFDKKR